MRCICLLFAVISVFVAGCRHDTMRGSSGNDYSLIAGTWKAEKGTWQVAISKEGKVESAYFPMGATWVKPNETTYTEMKDNSISSFIAGDFPLLYNEKSRDLQVTITIKEFHIKFKNNQIDGTKEAIIAGFVSEDGQVWDAEVLEIFDYGPRFPAASPSPKRIKFFKVNN